MRGKQQPLDLHVAGVSAVGLGVLAWSAVAGGVEVLTAAEPSTWVLVLCVLIGELRPLRVSSRGESGELTLSTPFAYALLLAVGAPVAVVVLAAACLLSESLQGKPLRRIAFNVGQYSLSLGAAGAVAALGAPGGALLAGGQFRPATLPVLLASAIVFFVLNNSLPGTAIALSQQTPVRAYIRLDLLMQSTTTGVLLGIAPIVVVIGSVSTWLVPLVLFPVAAVYRSARAMLEKDYQALHDVLTGLPNRRHFLDRVNHALREAPREGRLLAVMLIDLDRFKEVNDTLGHQTGDELLMQVGPRLRDALPPTGTIARLGGDEFAVVLEALPSTEAAVLVAKRLLSTIERSFDVDGYALDIGASIGIAVAPHDGTTVPVLMQRADVAMYQAKSDGTGVACYVPELDPHSPARLSLLGDLRRALDNDEMVVHYQPKVLLSEDRVVGVEALVRWQHPERGLVPPAEFIPVAERTSLIGPLTLHVLRDALQQCVGWRALGMELSVAVNLPVQSLLDPQFPAQVADLLEEHGAEEGWLDLELTESSVMGDVGRATRALEILRAMGIRVAIDDFGTGYSSLAHLKHLPVDDIKIDRSFVLGMGEDEGDAMIVRSTIELGRNLSLRVVAEGVEDQATLDRLTAMGCDVAQGYFLSRPVPADVLTAWMLERRRTDGTGAHAGAQAGTDAGADAGATAPTSAVTTLPAPAERPRTEAPAHGQAVPAPVRAAG